MSAQASLASLLLSIVVAAPCMRKNFCVPTDTTAPAHASAPARQQQPPPSSVKPASGTPQPDHPCTHRAEMQAKSASHGS